MEDNKDIMPEENTEELNEVPEELSDENTEEIKVEDMPEESPAPEYVYSWRPTDIPAVEPTPKKRRSVAIPILATVCAVLALAVVALLGVLALTLSSDIGDMPSASVADVADECCEQTVAIQVRRIENGETKYYIGTGIILTENGYIATNSHVVNSAENITVITYNGKTYSGKVIKEDPTRDIALIRINPDEGEAFKPAKIGDYADVRVGDRVVAIGTPYSLDFAWTVSVGHVSHLERDMATTGGVGVTMIQIDVPVNHGNSGGPLINENGEVIGIVTLKLSEDYEGINFAIPISEHMEFFLDGIENDMSKPQLGVTGVSVLADSYYFLKDRGATLVFKDDTGYYVKETSYTARYYLSEEESAQVFYAKKSGFLILGITEGSDANGKLREYDIITSFDGTELLNDETNDPYDTVVGILGTKKATDTVSVKYLRDGVEYETKLSLKEKD